MVTSSIELLVKLNWYPNTSTNSTYCPIGFSSNSLKQHKTDNISELTAKLYQNQAYHSKSNLFKNDTELFAFQLHPRLNDVNLQDNDGTLSPLMSLGVIMMLMMEKQ